jgi:glycosyltransferase involved in cell wall biosynthesis
MHILLIIEGTYPWYRGGVSEWVYQYLGHLKEVNFTLLQIATDEFQGLDPQNALYPLTENVSEFIRISPPDFSGEWEEYCENWYSDISNDLRISREKYDIIHVTNTGFAGWLGGKLSTEIDIPLLLTEHAIYSKEVEMGAVALECGYQIPEDLSDKTSVVEAFRQMASFTYDHAQNIITVSESNIPLQRLLGADGIKYIPNGIPGSWLRSVKKRNTDPVIGWVGRCAEMKNPLAFFQFVEEFRDREINPVFRMLLSDANEAELAEKVRSESKSYPEVECIWNQPSEVFFKEFDFLFITSNNESQPLVMLEALANKALPVGYKVGDLTEKYGLVFNTETSINTITDRVTKLWSNNDRFEKFVDQRFQLVKKSHTWESVFNEYKLLLNDLTVQSNHSEV